MKISDLDPGVAYAVNHAGRTYRAAVLFAARWETVRAHRDGEYRLVGYQPATWPRPVGAREGVPVLLAHDDLDPLDLAPAVREQMPTGALPDHVAHIALVSPAAIPLPWADYEQRMRAREKALQRAREERVAEQAAQDEARARVLAAAGPDAWRLHNTPGRWTDFETLAQAYVAGLVRP